MSTVNLELEEQIFTQAAELGVILVRFCSVYITPQLMHTILPASTFTMHKHASGKAKNLSARAAFPNLVRHSIKTALCHFLLVQKKCSGAGHCTYIYIHCKWISRIENLQATLHWRQMNSAIEWTLVHKVYLDQTPRPQQRMWWRR